jgi:hypothetical protein
VWLKRALLRLVAVLLVTLAAGFAVLFVFFPRKSPPVVGHFERTPERVERGRYLVEHVTDCLDCHSERDWRRYSGPIVAGSRGRGAKLIFLGSATHSANITPYGIGDWTDGEIARAISSGVGEDGQPLSPMMPYDTYAKLSRTDLEAVVVYLRTLPAIRHDPPPTRKSVVETVLERLLPHPADAAREPDRSNTQAYGRYLVTIAECDYCHRLDFSGGAMFEPPGSPKIASGNITPSVAGIGPTSRDEFIGRFKAFAAPEVLEAPVPLGEGNTVMPWVRYSGMTEEDLGAIWDYLQTVPPVEAVDPGVPQ